VFCRHGLKIILTHGAIRRLRMSAQRSRKPRTRQQRRRRSMPLLAPISTYNTKGVSQWKTATIRPRSRTSANSGRT
jgi:hypothetical protein